MVFQLLDDTTRLNLLGRTDRPALIPIVTSQTTLSIVDWPYKPTRVFWECFVLTRTLTGKLPGRSPIQRLLQVKHA